MRPTTAATAAFLVLSLANAIGFAQPDDFRQCVDQWRIKAISEGVPAATADGVLSQVTRIERVIQNDRSQPEFTKTFAQYYARRVTDTRIDKGRELLRTHAPLLADVQQATGVPPHYILAWWGLETNYGTYFGKLHIPSALATLACDSRRSNFFGAELIATLHIIAQGDIAADDLIGSWAGAIGHMQFMPTTFLAHAIDGDGDGRRDLMGNLNDALTSAGQYVSDLGWQTGYRWGREVRLPRDFDYALAGSDQWRPLAEWAAAGVTDVAQRPLAVADIEAALLLPTGHKGPAFLVYPNFKIIMGWNRSEHYALSVGRLADRIAGAPQLHQTFPPAQDIQFSTADILRLQSNLNALGFPAGKPDGVIGPATRKAIRAFQAKHQLLADGYPDSSLIAAVRKQHQASSNG